MRDRASAEIINGAVQTGNSSSRVGYTCDDDELISEAISNAAFLAVKTMVDYIIPEATVQMNFGDSEVMLNKGARDGIKPGMRMIVLRQNEIIGYVEIRQVNPMDSMAKVVKSMRGIQPEDKVRAIFDMPTVSSTLKSEPLPSGAPKSSGGKSGALGKIGKALLIGAVVFGMVSLFSGGRGTGSPASIGASSTTPTTLTWNPSAFAHGLNVIEYQVLRDNMAVERTTRKGDQRPVRHRCG